MPIRVLLASLLLATGPLAACSSATMPDAAPSRHASSTHAPSRGEHTGGPEDFAAIQHVLDRRARAVLRHDRHAFLATVDRGDRGFVRRQAQLYANLVQLPLARLRYAAADYSLVHPFGVPAGTTALSPPVVEYVQLRGTFSRPVPTGIQQTFVRDGGRWLLAAERNVADKVSLRASDFRPWFGPPIDVAVDGSLVVITRKGARHPADELLDQADEGLDRIATTLGQPADRRILVDATSTGVPAEFGPIEREQAAAVAFPVWAEADPDLGDRQVGAVVKINPRSVGSILDDPTVLRHELVHTQLREYSGYVPQWLSEGIAEYVAYRSQGVVGLQLRPEYLAEVRKDLPRPTLPSSANFDFETQSAYLTAFGAVGWLVDTYGMDRVLDLYHGFRRSFHGAGERGVGEGVVLRRVLGITPRELGRHARAVLSGEE